MEITPELQAILDKQKEDLTAQFEESTKGLKESQLSLLAEKKAVQEEKDRISSEADALKLKKAAEDKDVETLSASYEEKMAQLKAENETLHTGIKQGKISELASGFVSVNVVDDAFSRQAMQDVYSKRLDLREGKTVVLDTQGNLTALSIEDLNREIMSSSIYANHIKAGDASGALLNGSRAVTTPKLNGAMSTSTTNLAAKIPGFNELPLN